MLVRGAESIDTNVHFKTAPIAVQPRFQPRLMRA
jgi:hypothetical protein